MFHCYCCSVRGLLCVCVYVNPHWCPVRIKTEKTPKPKTPQMNNKIDLPRSIAI